MLNLKHILNEIGENNLICIYTDSSTKFRYGKILAFDELDAAIYEISPEGFFDGITVIPISNISRIESGGKYVKKMNEITDEAEYSKFKHSFDNHDIRRRLLEISKLNKIVISIELLDSGYDDVMGIVEDIFDDSVKAAIIDNYGYPDGAAYFSIEDITQISCMDEGERAVQRLFDNRAN